MVTDTPRPLRADAARNVERIVHTARKVFADSGPDAPLEDIARRADVGIRTLYRHFPSKADLLRAAQKQAIAERITPAVERALADEDPLRGFTSVLEATMATTVQEYNTATAARSAGVTTELGTHFYESLTLIVGRAQQAGFIRTDLTPNDIPRIVNMAISVLSSMDPTSDGWRRYIAIILDGLSPEGARPLPITAPPLRRAQTGQGPLPNSR